MAHHAHTTTRHRLPLRLIMSVLLGTTLALTVGGGVARAAQSANLIVNPDAETGECTPDGLQGITLPGWTITAGMPNIVCYGTAGGWPTASTPGPSARGNAFFSGGGTGNATMEQVVDTSSAATAIDAGGVTYALSGWLGGYGSQNDRADVVATFYNAAGTQLTSAQLGPVTNTDRNNTTEFLQRSASASVPAGTRTIRVDVNYLWTAGNTTDGYVDNLSLTLSTAVTAPTLSTPPSSVPAFDHVFLVYMENQNAQYESIEPGAGYIYGNSQAPYINNTLLPMGTRLNQLYATTHPSDPNYLAVSGGSVSGQTTNPPVGSVNATNLADRLEGAGKSWKGYNEGANGTCDLTQHGYTYPDDEPFTLYNDIANNSARCNAHIMPLTQLATDLSSTSTTPAFSWVAANDYNDMEAGGIGPGDTWLSQNMPTIFNSPAWQQQRSLLIVAWDEGYTKSYGPNYPNQVAGVVIGSPGTANVGTSSSTRYTQYSIGRTIENALGLAPLTPNDMYANPINDAFTAPTTSSLTSGTSNVTPGTPITFQYSTPAATANANNWVGLYPAGVTPGSQSSISWQYAAGTSGSLTFATSSLAAGTYSAWYLYNNGYTVLAGPTNFTVSAPSTLTTGTPSVKHGTSITFQYSTPAATSSSTNWIGIYPPGVTPGSQASITWQYSPGTSGSQTFSTSSLSRGNYAAWYLYNDGYSVLAGPVAFTVT